MNTRVGTALLLLCSFGGYVLAQDMPSPVPVTADDVLKQMDLVLVTNHIRKAPAEETVLRMTEIVKLNQLQLDLIQARADMARKPNSLGVMFLPDAEKAFADLRKSICKDYPSKLVNLSGRLESCGP